MNLVRQKINQAYEALTVHFRRVSEDERDGMENAAAAEDQDSGYPSFEEEKSSLVSFANYKYKETQF
nr:hypothetical protein BaRGS_003772 [Batillaria attramentaria]